MPRRDPFESAARKGYAAYLTNKGRETCPYPDIRKADGRLTFARAWRNAWFQGYEQARKEDLPHYGHCECGANYECRCPGCGECLNDPKHRSGGYCV